MIYFQCHCFASVLSHSYQKPYQNDEEITTVVVEFSDSICIVFAGFHREIDNKNSIFQKSRHLAFVFYVNDFVQNVDDLKLYNDTFSTRFSLSL